VIRLLLALLILSFGFCAYKPVPDSHITFDLTSPGLASDTFVYITGSVDQLGSWNPGKVKMEPLGDHKWRKQIVVNNVSVIEFMYTLGSWDREGANASGEPLPNLSLPVSGDATTNDKIGFWTKKGHKLGFQGQITGTVEYHRAMKGDGLRDRDVVVWLPPDYRTSRNRRYPVLYMNDGQNAFDPATSSFGVDWQADEIADRLIRSKEIPPLIIVGIYNTADRTAEYSPGVKGTAYMNFVVNRLKPFIDKTYRTKPDRLNSFVCGSSMGGLISFMLPCEYPEVFSAGICMSPAFVEPNKAKPQWDYIADFLASPIQKAPLFFYIDLGGVGLEQILQPGFDKMITVLKAKGYREHKDFELVKDPAARHSEADWAKRLPNALKLVLNRR